MRKSFLRVLLVLMSMPLIYLLANSAYASVSADQARSPVVNLLSLWGQADEPNDPIIKGIEKVCHVHISTDTYYTTDQFLERLHDASERPDIIIFDGTIYKAIKQEIANNQSELYKVTQRYYGPILKRYLASGYPHNVVYHGFAVVGILYNPNNIKPTLTDDVSALFEKAKGKITVIMDSPIQGDYLLNLGTKSAEGENVNFVKNLYQIPLTLQNFEKLYHGTYMMVTSLPERIATDAKFAFAFQWSNNATALLSNLKGNLRFMVTPNISYVNADLLANLNNQPATECVARHLSGKKYLAYEQQKMFALSPFGGYERVSNPYFQEVAKAFVKYIDQIPWVSSVTMKQYKQLYYQWMLFKLEIDQQNQEMGL